MKRTLVNALIVLGLVALAGGLGYALYRQYWTTPAPSVVRPRTMSA